MIDVRHRINIAGTPGATRTDSTAVNRRHEEFTPP